MAIISQREAHRLRRRVHELELAELSRRKAWCQEWFGGTEIARETWDKNHEAPVAIRTARKLRHAVVAIGDDSGVVRFVALPHPEVKGL